jgi:Holliday junction resolvase RusA-like endonuclease
MMLRVRRFRPKTPITRAAIMLTFYTPDRIKADLTNKAESCMDLLVDAGFLADDSWFVAEPIYLIFGGVDRVSPRVEILITPA